MSSRAGEFLFAGLCEHGVDLAADVAFQAADDFGSRRSASREHEVEIV
jgi:hypothetical protein